MALKWVNKNIKAFGGDPSKVTIAGNTAGGASVSILSVSNLAKGLF
jgi:para-nitrobenzyl esterase